MGNSLRHQLGTICGGDSSKDADTDGDRPVTRPKEHKKKEKKSKKNKKLKNGHLDTIKEDERQPGIPGESIAESQEQGRPEEPSEIQPGVLKDDSSTIPVILVEKVSESFASPEIGDDCVLSCDSSFNSSTEEDVAKKSIIDCHIEPVKPEILEIEKADEIFNKAFRSYGTFCEYADTFKEAILGFQNIVEPEKLSTDFTSLWYTYKELLNGSVNKFIKIGNTVDICISGNVETVKTSGIELLRTIDTVKPVFNKCIDDAEDIDAIECTKEKMLEGEETGTTGKFSVPGKYRRNMKLLQKCTKKMTDIELETKEIIKCIEEDLCCGTLSETIPEIKEESIIYPQQTVITQDMDDIFSKLEEETLPPDDKEVLNLKSENLLPDDNEVNLQSENILVDDKEVVLNLQSENLSLDDKEVTQSQNLLLDDKEVIQSEILLVDDKEVLQSENHLPHDKEVLNLQSESLLQGIDMILNNSDSNSNFVYSGNVSQDSNQLAKENIKYMASDSEVISSEISVDSTPSHLIKKYDEQSFNDFSGNHEPPQVHNEDSDTSSNKDFLIEQLYQPELETSISNIHDSLIPTILCNDDSVIIEKVPDNMLANDSVHIEEVPDNIIGHETMVSIGEELNNSDVEVKVSPCPYEPIPCEGDKTNINDSGHVTISSEEFINSEYNMSYNSVSNSPDDGFISTDSVTPGNSITSPLNNTPFTYISMPNDGPNDETSQIDAHEDTSIEKEFATSSPPLISDLNSIHSTSVDTDDSEKSSITSGSLIQPMVEDEVFSSNPTFLEEESLQSASLGKVNMEKIGHLPYETSDINAITPEEQFLQNDSIPSDQLNDPPRVKCSVSFSGEEHFASTPINSVDTEEEVNFDVTFSLVKPIETTPINYTEEVGHVSHEMCNVSDPEEEEPLQNDSIPLDQINIINAKEVDTLVFEEFTYNDMEDESENLFRTTPSHAHSNENTSNESYYHNNSISSFQQIKGEIGSTHSEIVESFEQPIEVNELHTSPLEEYYSPDLSVEREDGVNYIDDGAGTVVEICRSIIVPVESGSGQIPHNISHTILVNSDNHSLSEFEDGHPDEHSRDSSLHTIEVLFRENRTDYTDHLKVNPCTSDVVQDISPEERTFVIRSIPETPQERELASSHEYSLNNTPPAEVDIDEILDHNTLEYGNYVFVDPTTGDIQVMRNRSRSLDSLCSMASSRSSISRFGSFEFVTDFEINIAEKNQDLLKLK